MCVGLGQQSSYYVYLLWVVLLNSSSLCPRWSFKRERRNIPLKIRFWTLNKKNVHLLLVMDWIKDVLLAASFHTKDPMLCSQVVFFSWVLLYKIIFTAHLDDRFLKYYLHSPSLPLSLCISELIINWWSVLKGPEGDGCSLLRPYVE